MHARAKSYNFSCSVYVTIFRSMVLTLCFDAISRNVEGLGYSPFVMFSITSITKFPASIVILLLQDRIGRKAMASGSLLISGVFTIASGLIIAFQGVKSREYSVSTNVIMHVRFV